MIHTKPIRLSCGLFMEIMSMTTNHMKPVIAWAYGMGYPDNLVGATTDQAVVQGWDEAGVKLVEVLITDAKQLANVWSLLEMAKCPCCDGSGAYPDRFGEPVQCQWCDERNQAVEALRPNCDINHAPEAPSEE